MCSPDTSLKGLEILVVDDNADVANMLCVWLGLQGAKVHAVASGLSALQKIDQVHFDAVILDLSLPDIDGFVVLQTIKNHSPDTSVIIMSGWSFDNGKMQSLSAAGASGYVKKGTALDEVIIAISSAVSATQVTLKYGNHRIPQLST